MSLSKRVTIVGANSAIGLNFIELFASNFNFNTISREDLLSRTVTNHFISHYKNIDTIVPALKNTDIIIYCIGKTNGPEEEILYTNVELLKKITLHVPQDVPIIFISSIAVKINDDIYANSKKLAEDYLKSNHPRSLYLRPSVLYGPYDKNNLVKIKTLVRSFFFLPKFGKHITIQPLHIHDLCHYIFKLINKADFSGKSYVLSGPEQISIDDIVDAFIQVENVKRFKIFIPLKFIQFCFSIVKPFLPKNFPLARQIENFKEHPRIDSDEAKKLYDFSPRSFQIKDIS